MKSVAIQENTMRFASGLMARQGRKSQAIGRFASRFARPY
jgi:hypothetical protein